MVGLTLSSEAVEYPHHPRPSRQCRPEAHQKPRRHCAMAASRSPLQPTPDAQQAGRETPEPRPVDLVPHRVRLVGLGEQMIAEPCGLETLTDRCRPVAAIVAPAWSEWGHSIHRRSAKRSRSDARPRCGAAETDLPAHEPPTPTPPHPCCSIYATESVRQFTASLAEGWRLGSWLWQQAGRWLVRCA